MLTHLILLLALTSSRPVLMPSLVSYSQQQVVVIPPHESPISSEMIELAKQEAFADMGLSPAQIEQLGDVEIVLAIFPKKNILGAYRNGKIYLNVHVVMSQAGGSKSALKAILALILSHEYYHVTGPHGLPGGGMGNGQGGGDGSGCDCKHVGLQYWQMRGACDKAWEALQNCDSGSFLSLCSLAARLRRTLTDPANPVFGGCAEHCSGGSQYGNGTLGPPGFGFQFPVEVCEWCPYD